MAARTHRDVGRGKARHRKSRSAGQPQATYPTFSIEPQRFVAAPAPFAFNTGYSKYIGRVGALALALGVGVIVTTGHGLGVAHAEAGADSSDTSSTDGAPESGSAETAPSTGQPDDTDLPPAGPSDEPTSSGNDSLSTPNQSTAPEMQVDSSGSVDTSTNDAGQFTDDGEIPAESELDAAPADTEDSVAQQDSAPTEPTPGDAPLTPESDAPAQESNSGPIEQSAETVDDAEESPVSLSLTSTAGDMTTAWNQQAFTAFTPQATTFSEFETFHHVAPEPLEMLGVIIPRGLVTAATTMVGLLLAPFLAPGPVDPAQPPLLWVVLGWVRREINRTFFNLSPVIRPQDITLTLGPGEVSDPIEFDAHDADDDPLTYRVPERGRVGAPQHGTVTVDQATGTFTYKADEGYAGPDQFTVAVSDQTSGFHMHGLLSLLGWHRAHTDRAKIRLNVVAENGVPVANPDSVSTPEGTTLTGDVLANDTDTDNDPLTASLASGPAHGTVDLDSDGSFTYTPNENFNGIDSFTYTASDGTATSNTAMVSIVVTPVNDAPVAVSDSYTVAEDGTLTVPTAGVLSNDSDVDGDGLTATLVDGPANGVVMLNGNGSFVYKPDEDFVGTDTFTYTASDGVVSSNAAMVTVTVTAVNDVPTANGAAVSTPEDTDLDIDVVAMATDVDGDDVVITIASGPTHGELIDNGDGTYTYRPDDNYSGTDEFSYYASDDALDSATATVTITVTPVNDAPVANPDTGFSTDEDQALTIDTADLIANDSDIDGGALTVTSVGGAIGGTAVLNGDDTITFTPTPDFTGAAGFDYTISDGAGGTATATVTITVTPVNDAPVAVDDTVTTPEDTAVQINTGDLIANDTDIDGGALTVTSVSGAIGGTAVLNGDNTITFTPTPDFTGTAGFDYTISDGAGGTATATVTITVTPVNDAPVAVDDTGFSTPEDTAVQINTADLLANDTDIDGGALTVTSVGGAIGGTVDLDGDTVTFTPTPDFTGAAGFDYTISDGAGGTATATVTITVTPVNDAPVANPDTGFTTPEDTPAVIDTADLLANDTDIDGGPLTVTSVGGAIGGTAVLNGDNTITFTPTPDTFGPASFDYTISDGAGGTATATVTITVTPVNDAPVANPDTGFTTPEDTAVQINTGDLIANDTDIDGGALTVTSVSGAVGGTAVLNGDNTITFTPTPDTSGAAGFDYTISDGAGGTATATVTITVTPVNDAPVANPDTGFSTDEDQALTIDTADLIANDSDIDGGALTVTSVGGAIGGTVDLDGDTLTFTPTPDFTGAAGFDYTISDGAGGTATATVSLTVTPVNDAPVANPDTGFSTDEDQALTIDTADLLGNDSDIDGGALTVTSVSGAIGGTAVLNGDDTITFTPTPDTSGPASFDYTISDGAGGTATATVTITVTPVNDAPVANDDTGFTTPEDTPAVIDTADLLANDTDIDGGPLTVTSVGGAVGGTAVLNGDDTITFTPTPDFTGTAGFDYTISDGAGGTATATVTITVTPVNDAPVANDDTGFTTPEDTPAVIDTADLLANDTDIDGGPLTVTSVGGAVGGTAVLNGDDTITFTPTPDFTGTAGFDYTISDGAGGTATATVTITVTPVNDAPVANPDTGFTTPEDTPAVIDTADLLANDSDIDGGPLTVTSVGGAVGGTAVLNGDNTITFTPTPDFSGAAGFDYTISDGAGGTATATVTITVTPVNDAPVANPDTGFTTDEDQALTIDTADLLANDSDIDGGPLTVTSVGGAVGGTAVLNGDNTITFTPTPDFTGAAGFDYTISDGAGGTATATVTITVTPVNDAPVANPDTGFTTDEDQALTIDTADLIANDSDIDGGALTVTSVGGAVGGTAVLNGDDTITFTPTPDFTGAAGFDYTISDGAGGTATATVTITVTPVNDAPVANPDTGFTTPEDTAVQINTGDLIANDTDIDGGALTVTSVSGAIGGTAVLNGDDTITFTPTPDFTGTAGFDYTISDGAGGTATATVTITVTPVNDAPVAVDDTGFTTPEDTPVQINTADLIANDTDIDGGPLTVTGVGGAIGGTAVLNGDDTITFTPTPDTSGPASFDYTISDGAGGTATATVTITVTPVNDNPVANPDTGFTTPEDTAVQINTADLLANDTDIDGGTLTVTSVSGAVGGTVDLDGDTLTFTPTPDTFGPASFDYTISDGAGGTATATVTITVTPVNDAPVANPDTGFTTDEDQALTIDTADLIANDSDIDGGPLTVTSVSGAIGGTAVLNGDNTITFTPTPDFTGTAGFDYTISDGAGGTATATVTITVTPVNDAPVAVDDTVTTPEDTAVQINTADLIANDTDIDGGPLTVTSVSGAVGGTVDLDGDTITFTPTPDTFGPASFDYTISDGAGGTATATVTITVTPVNDAPVANPDTGFTTPEDTAVQINTGDLIANDTDIDGGALTVTSVSGAVGGTVDLDGDTITFTPTPDTFGPASFDYTISDGAGGTATATVTITVTPVNDAPVANPDTGFTTDEDQALTIDTADLIANDSDIDGGALTVTSVSGAIGGTAVLNGDDTITFTPTPDFTGAAGFDYTISDGAGGTATATVTITVTPVNDAPVAVDDTVTTPEDTAVQINTGDLIANDTDIDGGALTVTGVGGAVGGTAVLNGDDTITFTPTPDFTGAAGFDYTISDGAGGTATATVTITVTPVNDAPVAVDDTGFTTPEDTAVQINTADLLANDTDIDGGPLTVTGVGGAVGGTAVLNGDDTITFTPTPDTSGAAGFDYTISDGAGGTATATVTITVTPVNDAPVANDDTGFTTDEDQALTIDTADLIANDSDIDGGALTVTSVGGAIGGTAVLNGDNTITFTPTPDTSGAAGFDYTISDGAGGTATATVTITVTPVNDAPVANPDTGFSTDEDQALTIDTADLIANDSDIDGGALTVTSVGGAIGGTVDLDGDTLTFTPTPDFTGAAGFDYTISDGAGGTATATVSLTVTPVNDAPVANPDTGFSTDEDQALTIDTADLLGNDSDIDGGALTVTSVSGAIGGTAVLNGDNTITFTPTPDTSGAAGFDYTISDGAGGTATATVTITVTPVNDAPVANDDTGFTTPEDTPAVIDTADLLANDTDIDGGPLTVTSVSGAVGGTAVLNGDDTITFTPTPDFTGTAGFDYTISDGAGGTATATVTITVTPVNDAPVANPDTGFTTPEDTPAVIDTADLLANDTDIDGGPLTVTSVGGAIGGTAVLNGDNTITFTPTPDTFGPASFDYTISDGAGGTATATVTITVTPVNDAPVAVDDTGFTTPEDTPAVIDTADLLANDSDIDGGPLTVTGVGGAVGGTAVLNGDNTITFTPTPDFTGAAGFDYTISDGAGGTATATVTITVTPVNDAPVANPDTGFTTDEDQALTIDTADLIANDSDIDGGALTVTSVGGAVGGTAVLNGDDTITFTPTPDTFGPASFDYTISDGAGGTATATVTITVTPVNDAPVANPDTGFTTPEDTAVQINTGDLIANDTDIDGGALTVTSVSGAIGGTAVLNGDDTITFTPTPDFTGTAGFDYTISDGAGGTATATVTITVTPVNDAPVANPDTGFTTPEDTPVQINTADLIANDTDIDGGPLTVTGVGGAIGGTVDLDGDTLTFTPTPDFTGAAGFDYTISDGAGGTATATVTITVTPVNDAPVAVDDTGFTTPEDTPVQINTADLIANDTDIDGGPLTVTGVGGAIGGTAVLNGDDTITFTPTPDTSGPASFDYTISDGAGGTATATVTITVTPVNDNPVANPDTGFTTPEDTAVQINTADLLANDTDIDGGTLTVTSVSGAVGGTVDLDGDTLTFTPTPDTFGPASFDYTISDGAGGTATATVTITVTPVNDAPVANPDTGFTTDEDQALTIDTADLIANDSDIDGGALTVTSVSGAIGGTAVLNGDDTITFTPTPDFTGAAGFDYTISDGAGGTATATVTITVTPVNDAPVANPDTGFTTDEDQALTIDTADLIANDSDIDGGALTVTGVGGAIGGTAVLNGDDTITFTPTPDTFGPASFDYTISDGAGGTATATVTITVTPVNDAPVANPDTGFTTPEDTAVQINTGDLIANDTDIDGGALTVTSVSGAVGGTVDLDGDTITFTPTPDTFGPASFDYTISDGAGGTATATVTITVTPVNDAPVANPDTGFTTDEDQALTIDTADLIANDSDIDGGALTVTSVSGAIGGTAVLNGDDTITFTPTPDFTGAAGFDYTISDGAGGTATATVTITVTPVNDAPVAVDDTVTTPEDTAVQINTGDLIANDTDIDGGALTVTGVGGAVGGTAVLNGDDTITFTPTPDFTGAAGFDYTISDGAGGTATATVTITVTPVNDAPVAVDDTGFTTPEDTAALIDTADLLANDSDIDGGALTVTSVGGAIGGTAVLNGDDTITFTPTPDTSGAAGFDYTISDGAGGTATATVTITVTPVNDAPVANDDTGFSTDEDQALTIDTADLIANDSDIDGGALTVTSVGGAIGGTAVLNGDNTITFTPTPDTSGAAGFDYTISDGAGGTATATVTITVTPVNDAPVANPDTGFSTDEDQALTIDTADLIANDSDIDGGALTVTSVGGAIGGTVDLDGDTLTFTPTPDFTGAAGFDYTISDGAGGTATATVSLTVTPVNDAPVANPDTGFSTDEDQALTIDTADLLGNDSDIDGGALTVTSVSGAIGGTAVLNGDDTITFTPTPDTSGPASFDYTISDGAGGTATATVTITVTPVNDAPVANDDTGFTTPEDTAALIDTADLLANDSDIDGGALTVTSVGGAVGGTVALDGDTVTFTPTPDFTGTAGFDYTISDGAGGTATATVTITVTPVNDAPVANPDTGFTTPEDTPAVIDTADLLANDTDIDGGPLTVTSVGGAIGGTAVLNGDNTLTFTPTPDTFGPASFDYTISDGAGGTATATVTITVTPVNDAPVANPDTGFTTDEDQALTIDTADLIANDSDIDGGALTVTSVSGAIGGTAVLNGDDTITFTPTPDFTGAAGFDYTISDGAGGTATATVTITVTPVNDAPVANPDTGFTTPEDTAVQINTADLIANDTDIDGGPLTVTSVSGAIGGTAVLNGDNTITFTPTPDFTGTAGFDYTISDGAGGTATATVTITVTPVNDAPVAVDDTVTTPEDTPVQINTADLIANDTDIDGGPLTVTGVGGAIGGTAVLNGDDTITFTPTPDFTGPASFDYTISDGAGGTATATVTITVTPVNDAPVAVDDTGFTTPEDTAAQINTADLLANDSDIDGGALTVTSVSGAVGGTVDLDGDTLTFTPTPDFTGTAGFDYTISDGAGGTATATVTITVTPVNDAPVANPDTGFTTDEDQALTIDTADLIANDSDIDGGALTVTSVSGAVGGTVALDGDTITFTPTPDTSGAAGFDYTISDGAGGTATATVSLTVTPVNDAPVAVDDTGFTTPEDTAALIDTADLLANDSDIDGGPLTVTSVSGAVGGTVDLDGDTITFTPTPDFTGAAGFDYTISDGAGGTATATVTITVTPVNDAPVAVDDTGFTTPEDTAALIDTADLLANDSDIDGGALTVTSVSGAVGGTVALDGDTVTFTPTPDFTGTAGFDYTISDGAGGTATATVTITVTPVNDAPVANPDTGFTTPEDTPAVIDTADLLANDTDIDGGPLTVTSVGGAIGGTAVLNGDDTITFTPTPDFSGAAGFDYTISDGAGGTATATVTITVTPVNDAPVAVDDTGFTTPEDTPVQINTADLIANDTDIDGGALTVTSVGGAIGGTAVLNGDDTITFTPTPDTSGPASFDYTISDGAGGTATATVNLTVTPVNDAPVANPDTGFSTDEDQALTIDTADLIANDSDIDGGALTVTGVGGAIGGTAVLNGDDTITFTPTPDFTGTAGFDYTISDGAGGTATATVSLTVTPVNDAPVAVDDTGFTTPEDTAALIDTADLLANDSDIDGGPLTVTSVSGAIGGTAVLNGDNTITFTPTPDFTGTAGFDYTISDGAGGTATATVSLTVTPVNDNPIANDDTYTVAEDGSLGVSAAGVLTNDTDLENSPLTAVLVTGPSHGSLTLNADGSFTYTPTGNYNGADTFTYRASDGTDTSNIATVSINVTAVNDAPTSNDDSYSVAEDGSLGVSSASGVLANDTDVENSSLTAVLVTGPTHGTLNLNADGSFTYTPTGNYNGTDTFTYRAYDGTDTSNIATVTITVTAVNDAPTANDDTYNLPSNGTLTVPAAGVLTNDTDVENSSLTAVLVTGPAHGTLNLNADGSFTYTPTSAYNGSDSFTYRASDGTTTGNLATVTITDTIKPTAVDVQTTNASGGTISRLDQGDTITYTFSEPIDPDSILDGWNGSTTNVYVRAYDGDILLNLVGGNDSLQVFDPATNQVLPLGSVNLGRSDYVTGLLGGNIRYGLSGTPSTMTLSADKKTITVVLGNYDFTPLVGAVRSTAGGTGTLTWTPTTGPEDLAGNPIATPITSATESGTADRDF